MMMFAIGCKPMAIRILEAHIRSGLTTLLSGRM